MDDFRGTWRTFLHEFWLFGLKQARACVFGGFLLAAMVLTQFWQPFESIHRYDLLFILAVAFQVALLAFKLESPREALVILIFHAVATVMEIFKTSDAIGAWHYPESFAIGIGNVPLFAGFMYSAVGSYIARVWRLFDFKFTHYPPLWASVVLVLLIYVNFFTHHYTIDVRMGLLAASVVLYGRTWVHFKVDRVHRRMPLLLGWFLVALFIWFAENIGTHCRVWIYPDQHDGWRPVAPAKLLAWFLLMMLSFVLVSLVNRPAAMDADDSDTSDA